MQFRATEDTNVDVQVMRYCGDPGCCSWRETEQDFVYKDGLFEPNFDYDDYSVDEEYFFCRVQDGSFVPEDDEAKTWVKTHEA